MLISYKKPRGRFFIVGKPGGQPVAEWTVTVTAGANGSVSVDGVSGNYSATVPDGTVLEIEATASEHYAFTQWSDGNTDNPRTITVTSDIALSSENDPLSYHVWIYSNGNGDVSVDGTVGDYDDYCSYGTSLALEALPATDYSFDSWSDGNTSATRTVTVTGDIVLAASFQEETQYYSVNIYSSGPFTVVVDGVEGDYYESVAEGTELSVEAIIEEGSIFDSWSDGNTDNPRTLTVDGQIELTAYCHEDEYVEPTYLTVNGVQGEGTVSINGGEPDYSVTEEVIPGDCRLIEAFPEEGYEFVEWTTQGQVSVNDSTENPTYACAGNEEAATNIVNAVFQQVEQDFNVDIHAGANGSVSVDGVQGDYLETVPGGTVLEIEAVADEHYAFVQWSDGNQDNPRTLTVDSDIYLGSENDPMSYNVRVYSNGNGDVSVDGMTGDYDDYCSYGSQLELEAVPGTGYEFDSWSDGDTSNPRTLTVDDEIVLAASFKVEVDQFKVTNTGSNPAKVLIGIIAETNDTSKRYTFNVTNMTLVSESHELNVEWSTDKTNWTSATYAYPNFNFANGNFGGGFYFGPLLQPGESVYLRNFDTEKLYVEYKVTSTSVYYYAFPGIGMWDNTNRVYNQFSVSGELSTLFKDQSARNRIRMYMDLGDCSQLKLDKVYDTWHNSSDTRYDNTHYGTFASMFYGCSAITNPPQITYSQQTTKYGQYYNMFRYCTSLTSAPVFPETTITKKALGYTFHNCTALALIDVNFTTWSTYKSGSSTSLYNTDNWVFNVASSGTFRKPNALTTARGTSQIPNNWTIVYKG